MDEPKPVKLAAKLPKPGRLNGLETVHADLTAFGTATIIMTVSTKLVRRFPGNMREPEMQIEHVEGLPVGVLAKAGERLMTQARIARLGGDQEALPLDLGGEPAEAEPYEESVGNGAGWND